VAFSLNRGDTDDDEYDGMMGDMRDSPLYTKDMLDRFLPSSKVEGTVFRNLLSLLMLDDKMAGNLTYDPDNVLTNLIHIIGDKDQTLEDVKKYFPPILFDDKMKDDIDIEKSSREELVEYIKKDKRLNKLVGSVDDSFNFIAQTPLENDPLFRVQQIFLFIHTFHFIVSQYIELQGGQGVPSKYVDSFFEINDDWLCRLVVSFKLGASGSKKFTWIHGLLENIPAYLRCFQFRESIRSLEEQETKRWILSSMGANTDPLPKRSLWDKIKRRKAPTPLSEDIDR
jgi:hypothetical protein